MQADSISRLQNSNLTPVKTSSPLGVQSNKLTNKLDNIFASVKKQIDEWGENAKWKIDLVLLDKPLSTTPQKQQQQQNNNLHPLLSPQHFHPNAITAPFTNTSFGEEINSKYSLPISATMDYPWEYTSPPIQQSSTMMDQDNRYTDDLQQRLNEALERQHYLENIIWSQADQLKHTKENSTQTDRVINTMKSIFLMSQNEQKVHHRVEVEMLQRDIEILSKKLHKMTSLVHSIEEINPTNNNNKDLDNDKNKLLEDRTLLLRKIHLSDLRLSARDTEIEYLNELIKSFRSQPESIIGSPKPQQFLIQKRSKKGPPYLFQQQYSPRSSEVRSEQHHPLSGLESLGIVADQMLSDPEFESSNTHYNSNEKRLRSRLDDRRSQRSMDSAATLLAMPQLISSKGKNEGMSSEAGSKSPEDFHPIPKKPRSTYTRWTPEEDELLIAAVKKYGHSNWEACSRDIHGRSNIQCRNRWIRHLEHKLMDNKSTISSSSPTIDDARHSPSIAALLNTGRESYTHSPRATPKQSYHPSSSSNELYHSPIYRPPSPIATPKGKRRSAGNISTKW